MIIRLPFYLTTEGIPLFKHLYSRDKSILTFGINNEAGFLVFGLSNTDEKP